MTGYKRWLFLPVLGGVFGGVVALIKNPFFLQPTQKAIVSKPLSVGFFEEEGVEEKIFEKQTAEAQRQDPLFRFESELFKVLSKQSNTELEAVFRYIKNDKRFDDKNPKILASCSKETDEALETYWKEDSRSLPLKNRLRHKICRRMFVYHYIDFYLVGSLSKNELEDFYQKTKEDYENSKAVIEIRQIVLADEPHAQKIRSILRPSNFERLAHSESISPDKENGGLLPIFQKGQLPPVFDEAFSLEKGQISPVLKSSYGFHIVQVKNKWEAGSLPYERKIKLARKRLLSQKKHEAYKKLVKDAMYQVRLEGIN